MHIASPCPCTPHWPACLTSLYRNSPRCRLPPPSCHHGRCKLLTIARPLWSYSRFLSTCFDFFAMPRCSSSHPIPCSLTRHIGTPPLSLVRDAVDALSIGCTLRSNRQASHVMVSSLMVRRTLARSIRASRGQSTTAPPCSTPPWLWLSLSLTLIGPINSMHRCGRSW